MLTRTTLDLDLVRTFLTVVEARNFSRAAEVLLRTQSTVSLQIRRLEDALGRTLLDRSPKHVRLTAEGETFLEYARRLIALNDELVSKVLEPQLEGRVRLGTPEDFATRYLSSVLARFSETHPHVALEVTCDLTLNLLEKYRQGDFDLVLVKREPSGTEEKGERVWREMLVWVGAERSFSTLEDLPLVLSPMPCVYRKRALAALERSNIPFRISYTCSSLAGSLAAVRAGLGITVLPKDMAPADLRILDHDPFPSLDSTEIALLSGPSIAPHVQRLREHIVRSLEKPLVE